MAKYEEMEGRLPVFNPVITSSGAQGKEAMAEVFGNISSKFAQTAIQVNQDKSNAALYQATNQIYRLKNVIHEDFLRNPDQVRPLMDGAISDVKQIVEQTPLNEKDRQRLDYLSKNDITDIEAQGLRLESEHARTQAKISFVTQWPEKLQQIQNSWDKEEKDLKYQYENSQKLLADALVNGYVSQSQYDAMNDTLHETVDAAKQAHEIYADQEANAKDYHYARTKFHAPNTFDQINMPSNEHTNFLYAHEMNQRNVHDVLAALYSDRNIDPLKFMNLSKKEREEVQATRNVINDIKATFNSGGSWDSLEVIHKDLDSKKDNMLSTEERAAKTYLDNFFEQFIPDKYLKIVSTTPIGAQATHEHNMIINAIDTNKAYSDEQKESLKRDYDNVYVDRMVSAGIAKNIPGDKIMPINSPIILKAQSSFDPAGNPMDLLQTVDHYNQRNRVYVAQAMKTPEQKEIAYTVGVLEGKTSNAMRQELIAANQPKIDWSPIQLGKEGVSETAVKMKVQAELGDIARYLNRFPSRAGQERGTALISSTTNAVRYASLKRGEYDLSNYEKDVSAWGQEYKKAYNIYSGSNYAFNRVQQPQVSDYEWSSLGQYAIDQGHENMKRLNPKASEVDFMQSVDINPLYATITPDNHIIAQDQYGNIAFSAPYNSALLAHAVMKTKEKFQPKESDKLLMELGRQGALK